MNALLSQHQTELASQGWTVVPALIKGDLIDRLNHALIPSLALRNEIRRRNGVLDNNEGTAHHVLADDACYVELLSEFESLDPLFKTFFGGAYILNSYGGFINGCDFKTYAHHVHRDIRFHSNAKKFMLNTLVMLDEFTVENGATHILSGSQNLIDQPLDDVFFKHSVRITGQRGSILLFDSRVWHAAGSNRTSAPRRALTLTFSCPFFKQQLDYPKLFGYANSSRCNAYLRQVIGFNARVPESLDEFYVPLEQRFYQRGQD